MQWDQLCAKPLMSVTTDAQGNAENPFLAPLRRGFFLGAGRWYGWRAKYLPSPASSRGFSFASTVGHHSAMDEKHREAWEVSLAFLEAHRKIATFGAHCNACGHKHRWPIEDL